MTIEQAACQVRFDWGPGGVEAVGVDAEIVVWVDEALGPEAVVVRRPHPDAGASAVSPG